MAEPKPTITIPDRTSSKRERNLEDERDEINKNLARERKRLKPQGSFDAEFWTREALVQNMTLKRYEIQRKISLRDFVRENESSAKWEQTETAKNLFEQIHAQQATVNICEGQAKRLNTKKRSLRACFTKMFTTSKMGLGISVTGSGKRDSAQQSKFRADLIDVYKSSYPGPEEGFWCPILGDWVDEAVAAHLFAYMHGQDTMNAIFGETNPPELFSAKNGLLISPKIAKVFDTGFLVVVPQLPERPSKIQVAKWLAWEPTEYMTRIIDPTSKLMDERISIRGEMRWKDLDRRPLHFRSNFRPAARYLYFHYCLQILRKAWKEPVEKSRVNLKNEVGKVFWGTPGRYIPRNMLLAFVEELGHDYSDQILVGASCGKGDDEILLAVASRQVQRRKPLQKYLSAYEDSETESEDEDEDQEDDEIVD